MMYFKSREAARGFAKNGRKLVDNGPDAPKRWAVKVV